MKSLWGAGFTAFCVTSFFLLAIGAVAARVLIAPPPKMFTRSSFEFVLPPDWRCQVDGTETVCQGMDKNSDETKMSIIVIAEKWRNKDDTLVAYLDHLRKTQKISVEGGEQLSEVIYAKETLRDGYPWVEALHKGSEIPNYNTFYAATATAHKGILITMSIHEDHYAQFLPKFEEFLRSIKAHRISDWSE
jgi:hypothetical protein